MNHCKLRKHLNTKISSRENGAKRKELKDKPKNFLVKIAKKYPSIMDLVNAIMLKSNHYFQNKNNTISGQVSTTPKYCRFIKIKTKNKKEKS